MKALSTPFLRLRGVLARRAGRIGFCALFLAYCVFVLEPIVGQLRSGKYFGWDVGEYLLTARGALSGTSSLYRYPFPLLPAIYVPLAAWVPGFSMVYALADLFSGALMVLLFLSAGLLGYSIGRSITAAATCAAMVGTFSLILGEIGWGGQAQLLAFVLGAAALAVVVRGEFRGSPRLVPLAAGLLLGVAVLSEAYTAAFFVVCTLLYLLLLDGRSLLRWRRVLEYSPMLFLPLGALALILGMGGYASVPAATRPVLPYAFTLGGWERAVAGIGFGNPLNAYGYGFILLAVVVLVVAGTPLPRRGAAILAASIIACVAQVLFFTPVIYWDRAEFFVVFPLAVAAAVMVVAVPRTLSWAVNPRARLIGSNGHRPHERRRRWIDTACAVVVVVVIVIQSAVAYELYPPALRYYSVDPGALAALTWMRNEEGAALVVAPAGQTFSVANAVGRPVFPLSQPVWFDTAAEREPVVLADLLTAGRQWISDGPLTVVNTDAPTNVSSPAIFDYGFPYLVRLFDIGEGEGLIPAVPSAPTEPEAQAGPATARSSVSFSDIDTLSTYTVSKQVSVTRGQTVVVNLTFLSSTEPIDPAYLTLGLPMARLGAHSVTGLAATIKETFEYGGNPDVEFLAQVNLSGSAGMTLSSPAEGFDDGVPTFFWPVSPGAGFSGDEFNLSLSVKVQGLPENAPSLVSESSVLSEDGIGWVVVDLAADSGYVPRFASDPEYFLYWSDPSFDVFRVA